MFPRSAYRRTARVLLGALLLVQAAMAVACDWRSVNAAKALAVREQAPSCHQAEAPVRNSNLCLAHCLGADQGLFDHELDIPSWASVAVLSVLLPEPVTMRSPGLAFLLPRAGAPPPRILFHTLLI